MTSLEKMSDFFALRIADYDTHMIENVEGCKEGYEKMASLVPPNAKTLLDLGCGTGLELDYIFARFPSLAVTGIDLTKEMLDRLSQKHPEKQLNLILGDYFQTDFGKQTFDCAVSFESLHHFEKAQKLGLYKRLWQSLSDGGCYLECDYMVQSQEEEDFFFSENKRLREKNGLSMDGYYHYDQTAG